MLLRSLLLCFTFALSTSAGWQGYNFLQSDWSKVSGIDYATNKTAADYYDKGVEWYRINSFDKFYECREKDVKYYIPIVVFDRLSRGETIKIGVDYYAAMPISSKLFPLSVRCLDYWSGQVYVFALKKNGKSIYWKIEKVEEKK